jgi:hypothetical protein
MLRSGMPSPSLFDWLGPPDTSEHLPGSVLKSEEEVAALLRLTRQIDDVLGERGAKRQMPSSSTVPIGKGYRCRIDNLETTSSQPMKEGKSPLPGTLCGLVATKLPTGKDLCRIIRTGSTITATLFGQPVDQKRRAKNSNIMRPEAWVERLFVMGADGLPRCFWPLSCIDASPARQA